MLQGPDLEVVEETSRVSHRIFWDPGRHALDETVLSRRRLLKQAKAFVEVCHSLSLPPSWYLHLFFHL
jgi:hypothetical protein